MRLAIGGSIWHSVSLANVNFQPFHLHLSCPLQLQGSAHVLTVTADGEAVTQPVDTSAVDGLPTHIIMSSRGMMSAAGEAEHAVINRHDGLFTIRGYRDLGEFATEDEAIAAYAKVVRIRHKGKYPL